MGENEAGSLRGRRFVRRSLRGSWFVGCDLADVVVRGSEVAGLEIDSPWLVDGDHQLFVNGVDVVPLVDAELNRRFPGRALRLAEDPDGLRAAWTAVEQTWAATLAQASSMPAGTVDASVDGEWSFAQTLRHLVMATDTWLGRAILEREQPFHPFGLPDDDDAAAHDVSVLAAEPPSFDDIVTVRSERQQEVRELLAELGASDLASPRRNPHDPTCDETVRSCLHTILEEEWEHHRFAVRDLGELARRELHPD